MHQHVRLSDCQRARLLSFFFVDHSNDHTWVVLVDGEWRFVILEVIDKFSVEKESALEEAVDGI